MAHDPVTEGGGGWLVLFVLLTWLTWKTARALVRSYDYLDSLPPRNHKEKRTMSRYPLRVAGSIVGALTAIVSGLVGSGLFTADQGSAATGLITAVITLLTAFGVVVSTEKKVTPLVDPRNTDGERLTASQDGDTFDA
ncbi:hypothetical protein [Amycolatopsis sp. cmx-4-54]|uniref:hypothetical protein n=1 Tax=Amycolatopsis sp. cmx-4-54 TaxID=2790936 RepID=UPI003978862E